MPEIQIPEKCDKIIIKGYEPEIVYDYNIQALLAKTFKEEGSVKLDLNNASVIIEKLVPKISKELRAKIQELIHEFKLDISFYTEENDLVFPEIDDDGFLIEYIEDKTLAKKWVETYAFQVNFKLTKEYWALFDFVRNYYEKNNIAPANNIILKQNPKVKANEMKTKFPMACWRGLIISCAIPQGSKC